MPERNRRQLMLSPSVVQAVAQGRFHIHVASHVGEGMTLLSGLPFGELGADGYPAGSLLGRVQETLQRYRQACQALVNGHPARRAGAERAGPGVRPKGQRP